MRNKELVDNIFSYIARLLAVSFSCRVARLHICKLQMTAHCQQCSIHCVIIFQISDINLGDLICMFVVQVNVYLLSAFLMVSNQKRPMHEKKTLTTMFHLYQHRYLVHEIDGILQRIDS